MNKAKIIELLDKKAFVYGKRISIHELLSKLTEDEFIEHFEDLGQTLAQEGNLLEHFPEGV